MTTSEYPESSIEAASSRPQLLGVRDICSAIGISESTVHRMVRAGAPHFRVVPRVGKILFDLDEILAWMREQAE